MSRNRLYITFFVILILFGLAAFMANPYGAAVFGKTFRYKLGLDLQGGTHLVYQGDLGNISSGDRGDAMSAVRDVIERRVNAFGVSEPVVQLEGSDRLIIELPGIKDVNEAIRLIGQTPFLEFREENSAYQIPSDPNQIDPQQLFISTKLTGAQLKRAEVGYGGSTGISAPGVDLLFNSEGTKLFSEITQRNIGKRLAIFLDGELLSAPTVQVQITEGRASITGNFTLDEAKQLATRLNSGALPVPIKLLSQQNIGPTLGKISINQSLLAGLVGLATVALLMLIYYRIPGLLSVIALFIYTAVSLTLFKLFNITLTLAGIAGFILSIGMAIDANILIFERTKEELRRGKDVIPAIEDGFERAWTSIRDSNVSSLITTLVLGYFGSSIIRGFAITLGLGILVSMFSAITVTRTFLRMITLIKAFNTPRLFGFKRKTV